MVFFVEFEDGAVGDACDWGVGLLVCGQVVRWRCTRVMSGLSPTYLGRECDRRHLLRFGGEKKGLTGVRLAVDDLFTFLAKE